MVLPTAVNKQEGNWSLWESLVVTPGTTAPPGVLFLRQLSQGQLHVDVTFPECSTRAQGESEGVGVQFR